MIQKALYRIIIIFLFIPTVVFGQRDYLVKAGQSPEYLQSMLLKSSSWVPYPDYKDREAWDAFLGDHKTQYIKRGELQLDYRWQVIRATDFLEYERSGDRNIMQHPNSANNNALADLVMAELAEGKGRFMDQIINGVFYNAERTSWVLSAHLPAQRSRRSLPDHTDPVIDLGSGELGSFLAWVHYFFHAEFDKVDPIISKRLKKELYDKIIIPYRTIDRFWWLGFVPRADGMVNNWNPWTNFNCLQTIALLEDDMEQLSKDVFRSMRSVDKFINYVNYDGACEEGPSYWEHAAGKLYDYLQLIHYITEGNITLFDEPMIRNLAEYISRSYVGNGWVVNFADASAQFTAKGSLVYRYGKAVKSQEMMHFAAYLVKNAKTSLSFGIDFFRALESIMYHRELAATEPKHITPDFTEYPETQFYYLKNRQNYFLAVKGGFNAESHNHNDAGTFALWVNQKPVLIDAGVGTYTRQTFGPERYSIWTMRSNYHNLPSINGQEQVFGTTYKATDVQFNARRKTVSMNISSAYPEAAEVSRWVRSYQLTDKEVIVKDQYRLNKVLSPNEVHFMLWGDIQLLPGKILVDIDGTKIQMTYDIRQFTAAIETIPLPDIRLSRVWGEQIYRLTLTAKQQPLNGSYEFRISSAK